MCDNLGIDDTKVIVYQCNYLGQTVIYKSLNEILEFFRDDVNNLSDGDALEVEIKKMTMTRAQIESLPEFEGY